MRKYECSNCTNRQTPLCKQCICIKKPSGAEDKPSLYTSLHPNIEGRDITVPESAIMAYLIERLEQHLPLPIVLVMSYNQLCGGD
jgi:hypothetical protein